MDDSHLAPPPLGTCDPQDSYVGDDRPTGERADVDAQVSGADNTSTGVEVCIVLKRLPEAAAAAQQALTTYNAPPTLFVRDGQVVKLTTDGTGVSLCAVTPADLQCELTYAARWSEQTDAGTRPVYPPTLVVRDLMRRAATWAPPLVDLVRLPVFGSGWRLLTEPGYHADDRLFYHPDHAPLPPVSARPTEQELADARALLCDELLGQFPFGRASHLAAALAAMIVPFVRHRIAGATPLHLIDSPQPGTGKTLLADVLAIPALGKEPAANTEIASGDDLRKWVTAMALAGEPVVLIDNVNARLQGSALAAALTKVEWSDRVLGSSRLAKGSMRCLWLATGNNVTMAGELARRVVRCRLDAGLARPFLRDGFRHADLRGWAKANRAALIHAVLTLIQHWVYTGQPPGTIVLGSYEEYSRVIGGILGAAGICGFLTDLTAEQRHADDQSVEWEAFVAAWHEQFGEQRVASGELDKQILTPNEEQLSLTLGAAGTTRGRRIKLGQELRKRRDAVVGAWRLRVSDTVDRHGCWHYWLEPVSTFPKDAC